MNSNQEESRKTSNGLLSLLISARLPLLLGFHLVVFTGVLWIAFLMRFTMNVPAKYVELFCSAVLPVVATKLVVFYYLRSFRGWWRYVHFSDLVSLVKSSAVASLAVVAIDYFAFGGQIPRIVVLNDFAMGVVVLGGLRSTWRVWDERIVPLRQKRVGRALMVGGNFEASRLAHLINGQRQLNLRVVGFISPSEVVNSKRYHGDIKIVGNTSAVGELMASYRATTLFVVSGALPAKSLRNLLDIASDSQFEIKILPKLEDQLKGVDKVPIREVSYNDLLRREPAELDLGAIKGLVDGHSVMVTGAGGSIGSELCRQLVKFGCRELILLGRGENRIYEIERELKGLKADVALTPKIVNITDRQRMEEVYRDHRPELVFHAAAHKHVPLVEQNVGESIINNILGTKNVADLADKYQVSRFVMVSTDKAVNPTSVMGCTKHMAERYCQTMGGHSKTKFISTRFGNVLGSAGSVVPLFQKQIQAGGPITITDNRMTRYFMTIPEASQLVVQAATMGNGGEIFVLEMGQPVRILDLANDLIRLAGHSPGAIDIVESGIRPGEKMYEELYYKNEKSIPTSHDKILSSLSRQFSMAEVESQVQELISSAFRSSIDIKFLLKRMIPEFQCDLSSKIHGREEIKPPGSIFNTNKSSPESALGNSPASRSL